MESEVVPPSVDLLESMRSIGYSLDAALADLIDNSITAQARNVTIDADVVDGEFMAILDDGSGMTASVAREALRLAGSVRNREATDLGRFGLGLKTASLSQARCLTVVSKQNGIYTALRWDIDFVRDSGQWLLNVLDEASLPALPLWDELSAQDSGTLILWTELDLLLGDTETPGEYISELIKDTARSLALTFHRFLSDRRQRLKIAINGVDIEPLDPFLSSNPKTQRSAPENLLVGESIVTVEAFTLPHPSSLSPQERRRPDLGDEMRKSQGFYIYRNRRLISYGSWFGLARNSELSKQTRIKVDIPSSLDSLWHLDIRKSRAEPPQSFKLRLRQLIGPILERGHRVHTFRGRRERTDVEYVWSKLKTRVGFGYEINFDHQLVKSVLSGLDTKDAERVAELLQTVGSTFPMMDAYTEMASNVPNIKASPDQTTIVSKLRMIYQSGLFDTEPKAVVSQLAGVEPFNTIDGLESLVQQVWEDEHAAE